MRVITGVSGCYLGVYSAGELPPKITRTIISKTIKYSYKGNK